jgi:hypothetical protein
VRDPFAEFVAHWCRMNGDERESMLMLLDKLAAGRERYGPLNLDSDGRDWNDEASDEAIDLMCYLMFGRVKRKRSR